MSRKDMYTKCKLVTYFKDIQIDLTNKLVILDFRMQKQVFKLLT